MSANDDARRMHSSAEKRIASRQSKEAQRVPSGWVSEQDLIDEYDDPNVVQGIKGEWQAIPATLYTDSSGGNLIAIDMGGQEYYLMLRTD